ncbi:MAG: topoisomerase IV, partial [Cyanobacteria bacterium K_DeepCast_35m_m2_023]|nr:topoisomerase IV [Cyanobacteria bacterium K_DeepCast_35m_m2_023]
DGLQRVIAMITEARDAASARASLQVHLDLSERQADAVLAMPLRRLTGLEQDGLRQEAETLRQERIRLRHLLEDRSALLDNLVSELKALKKRYATPRRTRLIEGGDELVAQRAAAVRPNAELQRQQAFAALASDSRLLIQSDGSVKIVTPQMLGRLHLDEAAPLADQPAPARLILPIQQQPALLAFTGSGRVALLRWEFAGQQPGHLERFLPDGLNGDPVVQVLPLPSESDATLGLLSSDGRFKRLPLDEFQDLSGRAATVLKLKEGVTLQRVVVCREGGEVVVASSTARILRLAVNDSNLPLMGRAAQGSMLMRLLPGETVVGAAEVTAAGTVLLASRRGQIKRLDVTELRPCLRGDLGQIGLQFSDRSDALVDLQSDADSVVGISLSNSSKNARISCAELIAQSTASAGIQLELPSGSEVSELIPLIHT